MLTIVVTILIFLLLISLHEFGHFIFAKLSGVRVLEFAVGMGPAIYKKQGKETLYSIRLLPVGGYCMLEGEDEKSDDERAFRNQKLWKRFLVISAGAILNIFLGFLVFVILMGKQGIVTTNVVETIDERAYISQSGISQGDKIVKINGKNVNSFNDISYNLDGITSDEEVVLTIRRDGETFEYSFMPSKSVDVYRYDIEGVNVESTVNGITKQSYIAYTESEKTELQEMVGKEQKSERYILGFTAKREDVSVKNIFPQAYYNTTFVVKVVFDGLGDLLTGRAGLDQVSGPVGVATVVDSAVKSKSYGLENILYILAMLTINLGIFNLLPVPALDGGRLLFLLIELVFRKPVPPEKEGVVHMIGMVLLLGFAAVVMFNDILKLF